MKHVHTQRPDSDGMERRLLTPNGTEKETCRVYRNRGRKAMDHQTRQNNRCHTESTSEGDNVIVSSYNCKYVDKLRCFYTNTDTLLNKRSELAENLSRCNPDIIALTEILDKNRSMDPEPQELAIAGFDTHSNIDGRPRRGVILNTRSHLNANVISVPISDTLEESLWCQISLEDTDKFLIGVIYRSPSCTKENHEHLRSLIRNAC